MITEKAKIYRRILYVGMIDIRNFSYKACLPPAEKPAFAPWLTASECMQCVSELSEWLHDLALHSYHQFSNWGDIQEKAFIAHYQHFRKSFTPNRYPALVHDVMKLLN